MAFDFIKSLLGVKPATKIVETIVEPVIQETLKITEKNWKSKEKPATKDTKRYTKKQLNEMSKKQINELSKSALNVKLDGRRKKETLVEDFMLAQRIYHKNKK